MRPRAATVEVEEVPCAWASVSSYTARWEASPPAGVSALVARLSSAAQPIAAQQTILAACIVLATLIIALPLRLWLAEPSVIARPKAEAIQGRLRAPLWIASSP